MTRPPNGGSHPHSPLAQPRRGFGRPRPAPSPQTVSAGEVVDSCREYLHGVWSGEPGRLPLLRRVRDAEPEQIREVRKTVTAVFCDVVGSTPLRERLDAEVLRRVMDRYFDEMRAAVEGHGGRVEKLIGDAVNGGRAAWSRARGDDGRARSPRSD